MQLLSKAALSIPIFYSPNFSLGIAAIRQMIPSFAQHICDIEKVEIIDRHHKSKKDAPSGTALALESQIKNQFPVEIRSIREEEIVGEHQIIFHCKGEKI